MFRCQILINGISYEATDDLKNWDDFGISQKRSNYDGVIRSFSTQFEFVNRSYELLKEEFEQHYLSAKAAIVFYLRNNSWNWDKIFHCTLDFGTYSEDGMVVSINAVDDNLAAIIKAKRNILYEYPVADLYTRKLNYDRPEMSNNIKWTDGGSLNSDASYSEIIIPAGTTNCLFPLYLYSNNEIATKNAVEVRDIPIRGLSPYPYNLQDTFISSLKNGLKINLSLRFSVRINRLFYVTIRLVKLRQGGYDNIDAWGPQYDPSENWDPVYEVEYSGEISLNADEGLALHFWASTGIGDDLAITVSNFEFWATFYGREEPVFIDVISPITVLNNLLKSMTDSTETYSGLIDDYDPRMSMDRLSTSYIMAAESARGLPNAKLYTSYKKFCDWMEAEFGYVPVINENTVTFMHRDKLFTSTVVKDLGTEINDYEFSVNDSLIYSSVKVGYDKEDYDSVNGRDEFRFTNEFSTGLNLRDNTLSLISPYRADAYGIEFLVQKRGEDTTDNDSDNDVFFVSCDQDGVNLKLYRAYTPSQLSGLLSPETMFNFQYSPRFMLEANKKYIGSCTGMLKFTSSDGNSDVAIDGVKETDDFSIPERLFTVSEVEVETSDINSPDDLLGLVSLNNRGRTVIGYIKQIKSYIGKAKSSSYTLIVKDIKK